MKVLWVVPLLLVHAFGQSATAPDPASPAPTVTVSRADSVPNYEPVTGAGRVKWFAVTTAGPLSLLAEGPISAGWDTMLNTPKEYGPHWEGFGKRYGMRLTGLSVQNAMEATVGALWGEDPRYFPSPNRGFGPRAKYVIRSIFVAPHRDGRWHPAYARFVGNVGSSFISSTWRVPSENGMGNAALRVFWGVVGDLGGHAFWEFWPDVKQKVFRRR
jgi:hypothetical protein